MQEVVVGAFKANWQPSEIDELLVEELLDVFEDAKEFLSEEARA